MPCGNLVQAHEWAYKLGTLNRRLPLPESQNWKRPKYKYISCSVPLSSPYYPHPRTQIDSPQTLDRMRLGLVGLANRAWKSHRRTWVNVCKQSPVS